MENAFGEIFSDSIAGLIKLNYKKEFYFCRVESDFRHQLLNDLRVALLK